MNVLLWYNAESASAGAAVLFAVLRHVRYACELQRSWVLPCRAVVQYMAVHHVGPGLLDWLA